MGARSAAEYALGYNDVELQRLTHFWTGLRKTGR